MTKTLDAIIRKSRRIMIPLSVVALLGSTPVAYYGATEKNNEYKTLHTIERILGENGNDTDKNIALFLSMVKKESSFYDVVIGRDNEVGLLQLKPDTAQQKGLRTKKTPLKNSNKLQKLFYLGQSEDNKNDDRFNAEKNLRAGIGYLFELADDFQRTYKMDRATAIDFGLISYNFGINNVKKLFRLGYSRNPQQFIRRLSRENLGKHGITNRRRAIAVDYLTRTNRFRRDYEQRISSMRQNGTPTLGEYGSSFLRSFPEIYTRLRY